MGEYSNDKDGGERVAGVKTYLKTTNCKLRVLLELKISTIEIPFGSEAIDIKCLIFY